MSTGLSLIGELQAGMWPAQRHQPAGTARRKMGGPDMGPAEGDVGSQEIRHSDRHRQAPLRRERQDRSATGRGDADGAGAVDGETVEELPRTAPADNAAATREIAARPIHLARRGQTEPPDMRTERLRDIERTAIGRKADAVGAVERMDYFLDTAA